MTAGPIAGGSTGPGPDWLPLLRELGDLKRITSAGAPGSIAERLFAAGWSALADGESPSAVMPRIVAAALAAARLGDLDLARLRLLGLTGMEAAAVLMRGFDAVTAPLPAGPCAALRAALIDGAPDIGDTPAFVQALARQPRAGVTCPGRPRLLLQPAENHAEHSLIVAVYAALLAPCWDADPVAAFLAGMTHHLHSAAMPDAGYCGEILLGDRLDAVIATARDMALAELAPAIADAARQANRMIADDATPEARAFHAADAIDRVLETEQHLRARDATMATVLDEYGLVHDGPVKTFHDAVLRTVGLS